MNLMDLALKYRDYEWLKELLKEKEQLETLEQAADESTGAGMFNEEAVALEDILAPYAVKEKNGLRAFNIDSDFDRNHSDLVLTEKPPYHRGEKVRFRNPSNEELIYIRGMMNGYMSGYDEANYSLNSQLIQFYKAMAAQKSGAKPAPKENPKKGAKPKKSKPKPPVP